MKYIYIFFLLYVPTIGILNAQVEPIETIETDSSKISYYTKNHGNNKLTMNNQSYNLMIKLRENLILENSPNISFVGSCINQNTISSLDKSKTIFILEHVIDQSGNTLSAGLTNHGERVPLTNSEIICILNNAMNNTFTFKSVPPNTSTFYTIVKMRYKF